jgi:hypothetical protein
MTDGGKADMREAFDNPVMYWVGMNVDGATEQEMDAFNRHYSEVHCPEVMAENPGLDLAVRYRLSDPDPRGRLGPDWLSVYEFTDEAAAQAYLERQNGPVENRPRYTTGPPVWVDKRDTVWRMMWRRGASMGESHGSPDVVRMIGMDPAPDHSASELNDFNDYYTDVHLRDAMSSVPYDRGTRYELMPELAPRPASAPRYCAIYDTSGAHADVVRSVLADKSRPARPSVVPEPRAWRERVSAWRLSYERVPMN